MGNSGNHNNYLRINRLKIAQILNLEKVLDELRDYRATISDNRKVYDML